MEDKNYVTLSKGWLTFEEFVHIYQSVEIEEVENSVLKSQNNPLLTIILVTYNHAQFIENAIKGILEQVINFSAEIIIGDDDSTDGTREICEKYAMIHPNKIRFFKHHKDNRIKILDKQSGIFQIGYNIMQARGKYITLLSGDDYWVDNTKLSQQVELLENKKGIYYCWHSYVKYDLKRNRYSDIYRGKRIQTIVGRNLFGKLPREFFNILQEDNFLRFVWANTGSGLFIKDIEPAVIIHHSENLFDTTPWVERYEYVNLFWTNMIKIFKNNNQMKNTAKKKLISVIYRRNKLKYKNRVDLILFYFAIGLFNHLRILLK